MARLRPKKALAQRDCVSVAHIIKVMISKRCDVTLLVDTSGALSGILTDTGRAACAQQTL